MDNAEFKPLVKFDDQSESYVLGFEAGTIWQQMQDGVEVIEPVVPLHTKNLGTLEKMSVAAGYDLEHDQPKDEWVVIKFTRRKIVKDHLSLVT